MFMINKKGIWFITLFTLILVLSVYYVTMPSELLLSNHSNYTEKKTKTEEENKEASVEIEESEILTSLRVESDEKVQKKLDELKTILTSKESSVEDKNTAYEEMKSLNTIRGTEEELEKLIEDEYDLKSFIKIEGDQIKVVAVSDKHDTKMANNIMRTIQSKQNKKMYISVQFQKTNS